MIKFLTKTLKKNNFETLEDQFLAAERLQKLQTLKANKSRLIVRLDDNEQIFQSLILSIDSLNNTLLIDELFPRPENFASNQLLHCVHHENGSATTFSLRVLTATNSSGFPALLAHLPDTIEQEQRRLNFRLKTPAQQSMTVSLASSSQPNLSGYVKDLSNHGFRINIPGNHSDSLKQGDTLNYCRIQLNETSQIECQLKVRSTRYLNKPYRHTQLGTEITDLNADHQNQLSQYLNQQQREQCRLRAEYS
ncbi:MAG: flagellar brake protein [Gammaproteobacteria bacterium]|nr:flagellar brake protein [Gammaproteobacteria bacterium]